ncbi:MAG: ABC transporter permease [Acidobacteriota bacterium]
METILSDVRIALRGIAKRPGFNLVIILTLALGIGANTAIFSVVHAVLLSALPYPQADQLVSLSSKVELKNLTQQPVSYLNARDWIRQNQGFAQMAALRSENQNLTDGTEPLRVNTVRASANILTLLGVQPALGRDFRRDEEQPGHETVALLSHDLWQRRYSGDPGILGQKIPLNDKTYTVVGVLPAWLKQPGVTLPSLPPTGADVWIPLVPNNFELDRSLHNLRVIGRLKPGVALAQAREEMNTIAARLEQEYPAINANIGSEAIPLHEQVVGKVSQALWMLTAAVGLVLLIACVNVANLLLARAASRQTEIAIRTALGATRGRLIAQMLAESVVLSLAGGVCGVLLATWGLPLLTKMSAVPRADEIGIRLPVLLFALLISLLTALAFGLLPALKTSRSDLVRALKDGRKGGAGVAHRRWLNALVISEIALAMVLLIGAGLLLRSFHALSQSDPGFRTEGVLTVGVPLPDSSYPDQVRQLQFFERAFASLNSVPGVQSSAAIFGLPILGFATATFTTQGNPVPAGQEPVADFRTISPDYFRVMGMPLRQGREFSTHDTAETTDVIIVNEELARRQWPGESALGKRLQISAETTRWREVVGIVGNARLTNLETPIDPAIYVPQTQNSWPNALRLSSFVVKTPGDPQPIAPAVRSALRALDPSLPVAQVRTMENIVSESLAQRRFNLALLLLFAIVAGALAIIGIYGVMSYGVAQRKQELGVRLALGAQRSDITRMIVLEGGTLALTGIGLGLVAAFAATRLMAGLLAGISATDPVAFFSIAAGLSTVAMLASYLPARQAAKVDPMIALRAD